MSKRGKETDRLRECTDIVWVSFLSGSCGRPFAENLLHNLPAYFKALMQYCFSVFCRCLLPLSPIFCLIVIHVQSVCLANLLIFRPSQLSCFMSTCHRVYSMLPFVLSALPWWFAPFVRKDAEVLYKLKAFTAPWGVRLRKQLRLEQWNRPSCFHNCFLCFTSVAFIQMPSIKKCLLW